MTERVDINPESIESRLPGVWRIKGFGRHMVGGFADNAARPQFAETKTIPACFCVKRLDELWLAVWKDPLGPDQDIEDVSKHVRGTRERCIEWVIDRAEDHSESKNR